MRFCRDSVHRSIVLSVLQRRLPVTGIRSIAKCLTFVCTVPVTGKLIECVGQSNEKKCSICAHVDYGLYSGVWVSEANRKRLTSLFSLHDTLNAVQ